ncbi:MAG: CsbD family protein [Edaphobacter sp.]
MRALPWIIAGVGIGAGVTILLLNAPEAGYETGYDGVERTARKASGWGTQKRVEGTVGSISGSIKEGVGRLTGDDRMAVEGAADRVAGKLKDAAGQVGHAVGQTIHDLNK